MPTEDVLSAFPSDTLRAALIAAEKREKREKLEKEKYAEKKKLQKEIRERQKRLEELEKGTDSSSEGVEDATGESQRKAKRPRSDSHGGDNVVNFHNLPTVKVRKVDPDPSHKSPSCIRCRRAGVRCEWNEPSNSRGSSCLACRRLKKGCDLVAAGKSISYTVVDRSS